MEQSPDKPANNSAEKEITNAFPPFSEENYAQFIELSPIPAFVADLNYNFICVNAAAARFFGYKPEQLTNKKITDVIRPKEFSQLADLKQQLLNSREKHGDWEFLRKDGIRVWGDVSSRILSGGQWLIFVNDITKRKQAEQSFLESEKKRLQMQKIEALGRLAGGIAHDFNNFLAVILLHIDMFNLQLSADSPLRHRVNEIKAVTNNAAGIVRQLLAFGRKQPMNPSPVALNQVIQEFSKNLNSLVGEDIKVKLTLEPDLGICFVDQNQIMQVLVNLAVNARDAMPNGGILEIETANIVLDKNTTNHKAQSGGSYIQITVADNGGGMDSKTRDHIFEPFFSTKESDKGAGLGLAMVYGIVKQSNGFIWVESEINQGTIFRIQFSRIDQPEVIAPKPKADESMPRGNETILLVEDEEAVRWIAAEILKMSGYEVFETSNGMEALEIAQSYNKPIHLLLTDFSMPNMNGKEVAGKIKILHPEMSVLFMSGGNIGDIISEQDSSDEKVYFIGKPFSPSSLTLKVREVLEP
jgi:two-component system cell cycle sensor histidine kinase/response regulator CckA